MNEWRKLGKGPLKLDEKTAGLAVPTLLKINPWQDFGGQSAGY